MYNSFGISDSVLFTEEGFIAFSLIFCFGFLYNFLNYLFSSFLASFYFRIFDYFYEIEFYNESILALIFNFIVILKIEGLLKFNIIAFWFQNEININHLFRNLVVNCFNFEYFFGGFMKSRLKLLEESRYLSFIYNLNRSSLKFLAMYRIGKCLLKF